MQELPSNQPLPRHIVILGFISLPTLAAPPVVSRHVVLPSATKAASLEQPDFRTLLYGWVE